MMDQDKSGDVWMMRNSGHVGPGPTLPSISSLSGAARPSPPLRDPHDSSSWSLGNKLPGAPIQLPPLEKLAPHQGNNITSHPDHSHGMGGPHNGGHSYHSHAHSHSPNGPLFGGNNQSTPSLHNNPSPPQYISHNSHDSSAIGGPSPSASRRSSFDSRLNGLQLNSPLNSTPAASQISLASTLNRDRSLHNASPGRDSIVHPVNGSVTSLNHPYGAHSGSVSSMVSSPPTRVAPPIIGAARYPYPHPNAPSPTKGFPYAFPDPDFAGPPGKEGAVDNRRTSTSSVASTNHSLYSHASSMLHPNHALGSSQLSVNKPNGTAEYGHNHYMHDHRKSLAMNSDPANAATPYSRTPELRVSHKLAERKRRKEMKDLFDELRDALPAERGGKSSKWEVLTKAIEHINQLKVHQESMQKELETLRAERENYKQSMNQDRHQPNTNHFHHQPQPHHTNRMQGIERY